MTNNHLNNDKKIKLGNFYTPIKLVDKTYKLLIKHIDKNKNYSYLDLASGYGDFLNNDKNNYAVDIDKEAIRVSKLRKDKITHKNINSLTIINLTEIDKKLKDCIIVGNPPYNNLSSFYKKGEKGEFKMNEYYKSRDLGISFLKLYQKLNVDFIAVLHPLAYLIKESNFNQLKQFKGNYKLIDSFVFSSNEFGELKKKTPFPIIIAIYKKCEKGMTFDYIQNFPFKFENFKNKIKYCDFKTIDGIIQKYPIKGSSKTNNMFFTNEWNNALLKSATWLVKENSGTIFVKQKDIWKYQYLVIYKKWLNNNLDKLLPIRNTSPLMIDGLEKNKQLQKELNRKNIKPSTEKTILDYLDKQYGKKLV